MLALHVPQGRQVEWEYLSQLFHEFYGVSIRINVGQTELGFVELRSTSEEGVIKIENILLNFSIADWLTEGSLPKRPVRRYNMSKLGLTGEVDLPILFSNNPLDNPINYDERSRVIHINFDLFGSVFFLITNYEEVAKAKSEDLHGRFPANESLLFQEDLLDRPLVNEYFEVLWGGILRLWPSVGTIRQERAFEIHLSHDVDVPTQYSHLKLFQRLKVAARNASQSKSINEGIRNLKWGIFPIVDHQKDPFWNFDWIMEQSEARNINSRFYFMAAHPSEFDFGYDVYHDTFQALFSQIKERGHKIGFHPSYKAFENEMLWKEEISRLRGAVGKNCLVTEGRQHYLRFRCPETWRLWEANGFSEDASLGFAESSGFRSGTCNPYPVFDLKVRRTLNLKEVPLQVMESTLMAPQYMKAGSRSAMLARVKKIKDRARRHRGVFSLLWHNSSLANAWERAFYLEVLDA